MGQKKQIQLLSKDSIENSILKKLNIDIKTKTNKELLSETLRYKGFFYSSIDSVINTQKKDSIIYFVTLGKRIDSLHLKVPKKYSSLKRAIPSLSGNLIKTDFNNFENIINKIKDYFNLQGKTFSTIKLSQINLTQNIIIADLAIKESQERTIDKIIIRGYTDFPKSYLSHYLKIKQGDLFNQNKINSISKEVNNLNFAKTTKTPEALFKADSTSVFLYIEKTKRNSFDGLLNFSTNPKTKKLLITGNLNLEFINLLNTGEEMNLSWNANGNESQNINISSRIPFIFNSPISNLSSFEIHKQDSTFLNSKFKTNFYYNLSPKIDIGLNYETETSINNLKNNIEGVSDFNNYFIGLSFSFKKNKQHPIYKTKFLILTKYQLGKRTNNTTSNNSNNQHRVLLESSYLFDINHKNSIFIKNQSGLLFSENYLTNELYRIGGNNSIRGFNPQSIFTPKYTFFNLEYRIQTNLESYIYSITDFGLIEGINNKKEKLFSLGLGYSFVIKNSKIDLIFSGNLNKTSVSDNNKLNLSVSFKNFF